MVCPAPAVPPVSACPHQPSPCASRGPWSPQAMASCRMPPHLHVADGSHTRGSALAKASWGCGPAVPAERGCPRCCRRREPERPTPGALWRGLPRSLPHRPCLSPRGRELLVVSWSPGAASPSRLPFSWCGAGGRSPASRPRSLLGGHVHPAERAPRWPFLVTEQRLSPAPPGGLGQPCRHHLVPSRLPSVPSCPLLSRETRSWPRGLGPEPSLLSTSVSPTLPGGILPS